MKNNNRKKPASITMPRMTLPRFRLLPVVIFFSVLMLSVRVSDIWSGIETIMDGEVGVPEAIAQTAGDQAPDAAAGAAPADGGQPAAQDPLMAAEPLALPDENPAEVAARMLSDDPTLLTQTEIDLLQKLAERREEITLRGRELETREAMLQAAEGRIDKKIDDLKVLRATIEDLVKQYDQHQDNQLASLVKIYENMKPKDAAQIFEELEMETLLMVAERMKERSLAPVMAKMNPAKAREMTVELARMRKLPQPGEGG